MFLYPIKEPANTDLFPIDVPLHAFRWSSRQKKGMVAAAEGAAAKRHRHRIHLIHSVILYLFHILSLSCNHRVRFEGRANGLDIPLALVED
jgi:hypothetical protein